MAEQAFSDMWGSKDTDQPAHLRNLIRIFTFKRISDSQDVNEDNEDSDETADA